jgi:hypothetical protein
MNCEEPVAKPRSTQSPNEPPSVLPWLASPGYSGRRGSGCAGKCDGIAFVRRSSPVCALRMRRRLSAAFECGLAHCCFAASRLCSPRALWHQQTPPLCPQTQAHPSKSHDVRRGGSVPGQVRALRHTTTLSKPMRCKLSATCELTADSNRSTKSFRCARCRAASAGT